MDLNNCITFKSVQELQNYLNSTNAATGSQSLPLSTRKDAVSGSEDSPQSIWTWSVNNTKILLDLYKELKPKVGSNLIRNQKKLWEVIAQKLQDIVGGNISLAQVENRWRVLERAYKKYVDNKNKTGRGRKYFEYANEMDEIFKGKVNIKPVILLSSDTIEKLDEDNNNPPLEVVVDEDSGNEKDTAVTIETNDRLKVPVKRSLKKGRKNPILNRNTILEKMRQDRKEYYCERLKIERERLEVLKEKNKLIAERNNLLKITNGL